MKEDRALLLSRKVLDSMPYNTKMVDGSNAYAGYVADTSWGGSDVRHWLNFTFLKECFSAEEKKAILTARLDIGAKESWPGYNIPFSFTMKEKMFLLSYADVKRYFDVDHAGDPHAKENVRARAEPTVYALFRGIHRSKDNLTVEGTPAAQWWLRSRGQNGCDAVYICYEGYAHHLLVNEKGIGIRPAFWLDLGASVLRHRESTILEHERAGPPVSPLSGIEGRR